MRQGEISLEIALSDLLLGSGGLSTLVFQAPGEDAVGIMNLADSNAAFRCESCGNLTIITDSEYIDTECLVCKAVIPAGTYACPQCGWTYKES